MAANNGEALLQAAAHGLGITRQPDFIAAPFLQSGQVVSLLQSHRPPMLGIYAVLPSNRFIPWRIAALMDFLSRRLRVETVKN
jgi:DNA-binding transcriptional LysR family regulator